MGFLDPLFWFSFLNIIGIFGAIQVGADLKFIIPKLIFCAGTTYLTIRDWSSISLHLSSDSSTLSYLEILKNPKKYYILYLVLVSISILIQYATGLVGDNRLSSGIIRKTLDFSLSFFSFGILFQWCAAYLNIKSQKNILLISYGLFSPLILPLSKSSSLASLLWVLERWLNPTSPFFVFRKLYKLKVYKNGLLIVVFIFVSAFLSLLLFIKGSGSAIITLILTRLSRDHDIYIYLSNLTRKQREIFLDSGGFLGNIISTSFFSDSSFNLGALAYSSYFNLQPSSVGANPRLVALIMASGESANFSLSLASYFIVFIEIYFLAYIRSHVLKKLRLNPLSLPLRLFMFMSLTMLVIKFHSDVSSLKYSLLSLSVGCWVFRLVPKRA